MKVKYTLHADARCYQRCIPRQGLRQAVEWAYQVSKRKLRHKQHFHLHLGGCHFGVVAVCSKAKGTIRIITLYWSERMAI